VHGYFKVDPARVWPVIAHEFPALLAAVREELARPEGDEEPGRR
jgi:uncharacterized protein with HEPN domain